VRSGRGWTGTILKRPICNWGKASREERIVFVLFLTLALLWITRAGISTGRFTLPGWSQLFKTPAFINDGTVAMFISVVLFLVPAPNHKGKRIMDWKTAQRIPWNIVLLVRRGICPGPWDSSLPDWPSGSGSSWHWTRGINPYLILLAVVALMSFLTELTSNVASTQMLLPVFASLALSSGNNPLLAHDPGHAGLIAGLHAAHGHPAQCHHLRLQPDPDRHHGADRFSAEHAGDPGGGADSPGCWEDRYSISNRGCCLPG
jgi:di/tricarboxylate transporter